MKHLIKVILFSAIILSCNTTPQLPDEQFNNIISGFVTPSADNTVWCYWYWINDDISKEGITKDLEAMKKAGIGAALIGNINPAGIDGRVPLFSAEWWDCMVHAVTEGDRIGVDIGIFNCPGWSQSGGPWVKSDMAMRYLTYTETKVSGPGEVNIVTDKPNDEFRDTHTLAFKVPEAEGIDLKNLIKKAEAYPAASNIENLFDNDTSTYAGFKYRQDLEVKFEFELKKPITARQITIAPDSPVKCNCELIAEVGGTEKSITTFLFDRSNLNVNVGPVTLGKLAVSIPETKSDKFKLILKNFTGNVQEVRFSEINISESPVLDRFIEKQLGKMHPTPTPEWNTYIWETQEEINNNDLIVQEVVDISDKI
ncbi:MAG: glycosyl hydrolase, partial [Prolixibacteraceae bacterium]|nr:glycosyl hydrolase [Prolixibacteraceae bacterium]